MKIVHVIVGLHIGGAETMLRKLVEASTDHAHVVISLTTEGELGPILRRQGVPVHALGIRGPLSGGSAWLKLSRIIKQEQPDIVQTWMYHADFMGGLVARICGVTRVLWGVRTTALPRHGSRVTGWVRLLCAGLSRFVPSRVVYAAEASRHLHEQMGYCARKSVVIANGFEIQHLLGAEAMRANSRRALGFCDTDQVVGCVGRFHDDKDHLNFLRAAAFVRQRHRDTRFALVGRGLDTSNADLTRWISELGLADAVLMLGERQDVPACLAAFDVFCLSSKTEGFPNVVGEAMGVGLPCVVTDVGDARKLVGDCGMVVPPRNAVALADGLLQILKLTQQERSAIGRRAQARVAQEFSMSATAGRFANLYTELMLER